MLDQASQIMLTSLSILGFFLIAKKNKWGFVISLFGQPFWFYTSIVHQQWGIVFNTAIFTVIFIYGVYNWFYTKEKKYEE